MGEVDRRGKATLAILIAISSCILLVGCIFIIFFTSGVSTEMKLRAELINHLDARRRAEASSNYKTQFLANMRYRFVRYNSWWLHYKNAPVKLGVLLSFFVMVLATWKTLRHLYIFGYK